MSNLKTCFHDSKDEMAKVLSKSFYTVTYSVEVIIIAKTAWYMNSSIFNRYPSETEICSTQIMQCLALQVTNLLYHTGKCVHVTTYSALIFSPSQILKEKLCD